MKESGVWTMKFVHVPMLILKGGSIVDSHRSLTTCKVWPSKSNDSPTVPLKCCYIIEMNVLFKASPTVPKTSISGCFSLLVKNSMLPTVVCPTLTYRLADCGCCGAIPMK